MRLKLALAACLLTSPAWAVDPTPRQAYPTAGDHGSAIVTVGGGLDVTGFAVPCGSSTIWNGCGFINGVAAAAAPITGAVSVNNFPATQPVSGTFYQASQPVADPANAAFQGAVLITPGTATTAQRSIGFICSSAGNITVTFPDASTMTLGIVVSPTLQTLPLAVTNIALGSGTAGTFWGLK